MNRAWAFLTVVCALVCGIYAYTARSGFLVSTSLNPADDYYNLLVQGFRAGQLSVKKVAPAGLVQLPDPYDRKANEAYGLLDLSYYRGKLYLYYGVTPAVLLLWPYVALTGNYLPQKDAVVVFCIIGFLVSTGLLAAIWRRYFANVNVTVVAAGALALGLVTGTASLLARCDVWEVSISCGYALAMVALAGIWKALHEPKRRCWWLAAASLAYGLAVGARPSLLFGGLTLLVPVVQARRERGGIFAPLLAAAGPIMLVGIGLMSYNALRFDNPFEFGLRYVLSGDRQVTGPPFSLHYLWFNIRIFYLEPAHWTTRFPFVHDITMPLPPSGYGRLEHPFGILANIPIVWLALAAPLAWRDRPADARSILSGFLTAVAIVFGASALTLGLFLSASIRYQVDLLPSLVLLAVIGILSLERAAVSQPRRRRVMRWGWSLLLAFSVVFSVLVSNVQSIEACNNWGMALVRSGKIAEGIAQYERALQLKPDYAEAHNNLGLALMRLNRVAEALGHFQQAVAIRPDSAEAHGNWGLALVHSGRPEEGIAQYEQALQLRPDYAGVHNNLGLALMRLNRMGEAVGHFEQAVTINPDFAAARNNLGNALSREGRVSDAIVQYEQALQIDPNSAAVENDLGLALARLGKLTEAIGHYQRALQIDPHYAGAYYNLGNALQATGDLPDAIAHYQEALRIDPNDADAHSKLGIAFMNAGQTQEAARELRRALQLNPNLAEAQSNLTRLSVAPAR